MEANRSFPRAIAYLDFLVAVVLGLIGLYLLTSPLHSNPDDSHRGLMAVFPGILLLLLASLAYLSGKLLLRRHFIRWPLQALVTAGVCVLTFALLAR
jgi:hypothetical protein